MLKKTQKTKKTLTQRLWSGVLRYGLTNCFYFKVPRTLKQTVIFWRRLRGSSNKSDPEIP